MEQHKELKVSAIKNGTVLDHIPSGMLFKVINILGLQNCGNQMTFGTNLESKMLGHKAIIKIADKFFKDEEINKIALVAPQAKLNIIKDYEVVEKRILTVPDEIIGIVKCQNPKCVTNHQPVSTRFKTIHKGSKLMLDCHFCEKLSDGGNLIILGLE